MTLNILPYLRPEKASIGLYNIDLCYLSQVKQEPPRITFIANDKIKIQDVESLGITGSQLVKISFENLSKIEIEIDDSNINHAGVLIINQEFSSEKILDKIFTQKIAVKLLSENILVAIPVRNTLLACNSNDEKAVQNLTQESQKLYHNFAKETISDLIFTIRDGIIITAHLPSVTTLDQMEDMKNNLGSYSSIISKSTLFQNLYNFQILVEAEEIQDLQNGIFYSIFKIINETKKDKDFNNTINIISSSNSAIDKTRENVVKIRELFDKVYEKYHSIYSSRTEPIKITFLFHKDYTSGNNHKKIIKHLN